MSNNGPNLNPWFNNGDKVIEIKSNEVERSQRSIEAQLDHYRKCYNTSPTKPCKKKLKQKNRAKRKLAKKQKRR